MNEILSKILNRQVAGLPNEVSKQFGALSQILSGANMGQNDILPREGYRFTQNTGVQVPRSMALQRVLYSTNRAQEQPQVESANVQKTSEGTQMGQLQKVISEYFGKESNSAFKTLQNENARLDPRAENVNKNGSIDRGVFQINSSTFEDFMKRKGKLLAQQGITSFEDMYDPVKNTAMAKIIYDEQGWDAWYGSPDSIISDSEKKRRINMGVGKRE